jgi:pantoate--beta-alanine ligase
MLICTTIKSLREILDKSKRKVCFVPTMGALHKGHVSLLQQCPQNNLKVCSIFVNPTQFNDPEDLKKYPRPLSDDIHTLIKHDCDLLFLPSIMEVYPDKSITSPNLELHGIDQRWEGAYRPGHFEGMLQVVYRLLSIVKPDLLVMGQKDYQQQLLVQKMLEQQIPDIKLITGPTLRESDGLAMSSRNIRLSCKDREIAKNLYRVLRFICAQLPSEQIGTIIKNAKIELNQNGFSVEYLAVVNPNDMKEVDTIKKGDEGLIIVAAQLGKVRLIDNIYFKN